VEGWREAVSISYFGERRAWRGLKECIPEDDRDLAPFDIAVPGDDYSISKKKMDLVLVRPTHSQEW
jgi:hypothetical protein